MLHKAQTRGLQVCTWIPSTARLPAKVGNAIAGRVSTPWAGEGYFNRKSVLKIKQFWAVYLLLHAF